MISYNKLLSQHMAGGVVKKTDCFLQKLTDIHLKSGFKDKGGFNAEYKKVFIYLSLALPKQSVHRNYWKWSKKRISDKGVQGFAWLL